MGKRKWGDWTEHYHQKKKKKYYYNARSKESTFTAPEGFEANAVDPAAPPKKRTRSESPWQKGFSKSKQKTFWYNKKTKKYVWEKPEGWSEASSHGGAAVAASSSRPAVAASSSRPAASIPSGLDERHLMVFGFPPDTTEAAVRTLLQKYGTIHRLDLVADIQDSSKTRGYAFVVYTDVKAARSLYDRQGELELTLGGQCIEILQVVAGLNNGSGKIEQGWGEISNQGSAVKWGDVPKKMYNSAGGRRGYNRGRR